MSGRMKHNVRAKRGRKCCVVACWPTRALAIELRNINAMFFRWPASKGHMLATKCLDRTAGITAKNTRTATTY